MTLKYNSFNAKLYRYFYGTKDMPNSICAYAWKLLLAWVFITPVTVLSFPCVIGEIIQKESYGLSRIAASLFIYMALYCVTSMVFTVMLFFNNYDSNSTIVKIGSSGVIVWLFVIVISIVESVKYIRSNNKLEDSVIVGFVKSKYNKYCIKITWK